MKTRKIVPLCFLVMFAALIYIEFLSIQANVILYDTYQIHSNPLAIQAVTTQYIILAIGLLSSLTMFLMSFKKEQ